MSDINITYKNSSIATMDASGTKTIETAGKYCEDDITIEYVRPEPVLESLSVSENGEYTPGLGVDGFSQVSVNVQSGDSKENGLIERTISGTYFNANISRVGEYAFANCYNLNSVELPNCTTILQNAFYICKGLSTVVLQNCSGIYACAFQSCSSLKNISLPMCNSLAQSAFAFCDTLNSISLPSISTIGIYAFMRCRKLLSVYLLGTSFARLSATTAFSSTPIDGYTTSTGGVYGSIYVRASMLESYKTESNWSHFSSRFVGLTDAEIEALDNAN